MTVLKILFVILRVLLEFVCEFISAMANDNCCHQDTTTPVEFRIGVQHNYPHIASDGDPKW